MKFQTEWKFNMVPIEIPLDLPRNFEGKWRLIIETVFNEKKVVKKECLMVKFDLVDI